MLMIMSPGEPNIWVVYKLPSATSFSTITGIKIIQYVQVINFLYAKFQPIPFNFHNQFNSETNIHIFIFIVLVRFTSIFAYL